MTAPVLPTRPRRALDGVLLLDKPVGITSQAAVSWAKRLYSAAKAGHTGTLDPMAGGLLPVCFGEATKFSHLMIEADKEYCAVIRLGMTTTTGDMEGAITAEVPVSIVRPAVEQALSRFSGDVLQTPPMYSAIKHGGKPLYRYARAGIEVERAPRVVCIRRIALEACEQEEITISVKCSKGTYVRVLAEDIGRALGCGACLRSLRRTAVGGVRVDGALTFEYLESVPLEKRDEALQPVDMLVAGLPRVDLDAGQARKIMNGGAVEGAMSVPRGLVRIYGPEADYLGVAEAGAGGRITPRRLMATCGSEPHNAMA
ncbi:MAG: tRNA pseudouridine(55) synthase TruB [Betaproteobacteria bacterium]